jgi:hypothetical protein
VVSWFPLDRHKRPATVEDLWWYVQKEGESTRRWLRRWSELWNSSNSISADTTILIFKENCKFDALVQKLKRTKVPVTTINELMAIAGHYADSEDTKDNSEDDSDERKDGKGKGQSRNGSRDKGHNGHKRKGDGSSELVTQASGAGYRDSKSRRGNGNGGSTPRKKLSSTEIFDGPCIIHSKGGRVTAHSTKDCFQFKELATLKKGDKGADKDDKSRLGKLASVLTVTHAAADESGFGKTAGVFHTFHGTTNKQEQKLFTRAVSATIPDVP